MDMTQISQMPDMQNIQQNAFSAGQISQLMSSGVSFADIIQMMLTGTQTGSDESQNSDFMGIINALTENLMEGQLTEEQMYYPVMPQDTFAGEAYKSGLSFGLNNIDNTDIKISDFSEDIISADPVQLSGLLGVVRTGNSIPQNNGIISTLYKEIPVNNDNFSISEQSAYDLVNKYIESGELEIVGYTHKNGGDAGTDFKLGADSSVNHKVSDNISFKIKTDNLSAQKISDSLPVREETEMLSAQKVSEGLPVVEENEILSALKVSDSLPVEEETEMLSALSSDSVSAEMETEMLTAQKVSDSLPVGKETEMLSAQKVSDSLPVEEETEMLTAQKVSDSLPVGKETEMLTAQKVSDSLPVGKETEMLTAQKVSDSLPVSEDTEMLTAQKVSDSLPVEEETEMLTAQKVSDSLPVRDEISAWKASDGLSAQKETVILPSQSESDNMTAQSDDEKMLSFYRTMQNAKDTLPASKKTETDEPVEISVLQENTSELDIRFDQITSDIKMKENFEPPEKQLLKGVEENLKKGNNEFTVKLRPEGLGEIIVKLVKSESGKMFMSMAASNLKTAELLNSNLSSLQSSLSQHNVEIVNPSDMTSTVMAMTPAFEQYYGQSGSNQQNQQFYNRNHGFTAYSEVDDAETFNEKAAASVEKSGLDIVI